MLRMLQLSRGNPHDEVSNSIIMGDKNHVPLSEFPFLTEFFVVAAKG